MWPCLFFFQLATASFFEGDADGGTGSVESPPQSDNDEQDTPPPAIHFHGPGSSKPKSKSKEKSKASKPKFGTIASLKQQEEEEDDSDDEEGQAFYAGGSLHSGQQVIGPSKFFEWMHFIWCIKSWDFSFEILNLTLLGLALLMSTTWRPLQ